MTMAAQIGAEARRGRLLLPLKPKESESFQGYVVRLAEWNAFGGPGELLWALGLRLPPKQQWPRPPQVRNDDFVWRLGADPSSIEAMLSWSDPDGANYISRIGKSRRVSPIGLRREVYHREYWGVSQLSYCPESWDELLSKCPQCAQRLTWSVLNVDECSRCKYDLKRAATPSVAEESRPSLRFMAELLSRDSRKREAAKLTAPPEFQSYSPMMIFDLAAMFGHAANVDSVIPRSFRLHTQVYEAALLAEGAQILLEYPQSFRRLYESKANSVTPDFLGKLRRFGRFKTPTRLPLNELIFNWEPIAHGPSRLKRNREQEGQLTLRQAAERLGVQNSKVRQLVNAQLMTASPSRGAQRAYQWFDPDEAQRVGDILADRASLEKASQVLGLPVPGIDQMLAVGMLKQNTSGVVGSLHPGRNFYYSDMYELISRLELNLCDPAIDGAKMLTLEELFHGIGAQPKPWATVLSGILAGRVPAYYGNGLNRLRVKCLRVSDDFAREVVAGARSELLHIPVVPRESPFFTRRYARSDAERYLNCYPRDLTWLRVHGEIRVREDYIWIDDLEKLGKRLISSREIMWRWRVSPELREGLAAEHGIRRVKGPFWPRAAVESHFSKLFGSRGRTSS